MENATPGPWEYDSNVKVIYGGRRYARSEDTPEGFTPNSWNEVCSMQTFFNYQTREYDSARTKANAAIVAAAPTLLAVCKTLVETWEANKGEIMGEDVELVRQAIAKAEGLSCS